MGILLAEASGSATTMTSIISVGYIVVFFAIIYFAMIRPQKKEQQKMSAMLASLELGDTVMTSGGFYGTVIDISDDMVIVEFGNNKNCRIPMNKTSIAQVEKPNAD